jgi:hypothetical protein
MLRCTNNGNFTSITVGNNYAISRETRDYYYIVNDQNLRARYGKRYFEVIPDEVPDRPAAAPRREEPVITPLRDVGELDIYVEENNRLRCDWGTRHISNSAITGLLLTLGGTAVGTYSAVVQGVNGLIDRLNIIITDNFARNRVSITPEQRTAILEEMLAVVFEETLARNEDKTLVFCNLTGTHDDIIRNAWSRVEAVDDVECFTEEYTVAPGTTVLMTSLVLEAQEEVEDEVPF